MTTSKKPPPYQTYLLTCWQERDEVMRTAVWRFRLETPKSGQRRSFSTLDELFSTIKTELQVAGDDRHNRAE